MRSPNFSSRSVAACAGAAPGCMACTAALSAVSRRVIDFIVEILTPPASSSYRVIPPVAIIGRVVNLAHDWSVNMRRAQSQRLSAQLLCECPSKQRGSSKQPYLPRRILLDLETAWCADKAANNSSSTESVSKAAPSLNYSHRSSFSTCSDSRGVREVDSVV